MHEVQDLDGETATGGPHVSYGPITDALRARANANDKDTLHWLPWRQGTGRGYECLIFAQMLDYPSGKDTCIGKMDTALLAAEVVNAHNIVLRQTQENMEDERMGDK